MPSRLWNRLGIWIGIILIFALQCFFANRTLSKGQVVKQFYAHSITSSLAENGFKPLATSLPCFDAKTGASSRPWAEEPPIFHATAALAVQAGLTHPSLIPMLSGLILLGLLGLWARHMNRDQALVFFALIALTPGFMTYFTQHLPDLFATVWLIAGAWSWMRERRWSAWLCLTLAVTSKATTVFAAGAILASDVFEPAQSARNRFQSGIRTLWMSIAMITPFMLWLWVVKNQGVPNPFAFKSVINNRHSGHWSMLTMPNYWGHFFTWMTLAGVGIPLFACAVWRLIGLLRARAWQRASRAERLLALWALALIPHWIFLRAGNYTHDYYSLPFLLPFAALGASQLLRLRSVLLKTTLLVWSLTWGLRQPWKLEQGAKTGQAPTFCEAEKGS